MSTAHSKVLDELNAERRAAAALVEARAAKERERPKDKDSAPAEAGLPLILCGSACWTWFFTCVVLCADSPTTAEEVEGPVQTDDFRVFEASVCEEGMILSVND